MTAVEKLIATARAELGYMEKRSNAQLDDKTANAGYNNYTKYARDLDKLGIYNGPKNGFAWCDVFVDWCFVQTFGLEAAMKLTCQPMGGYGAGCTNSMGYYKAKGQFTRTRPQPGDQIFFTNDGGKESYHTGIVVGVDGSYVHTIEGNTSGASGVVENGGAVCAKSYLLTYNKIAGYGRPAWDIIGEDDEEMTQEQFDKMMDNYLQRKAKEAPEEWSEDDRKWAEENGIIKGKGNGMEYKSHTTREEMVAFLHRLAIMFGK